MTRPFIIAIAGGTASGKSTLAEVLAARLEAESISHDCYYKTVPPEIANAFNRVEAYNYDHPDSLNSALLAQHLRELRAGRTVLIPEYDYATSTAIPEVTEVDPTPFIIVDGILILAEPELLPLFDFIIFVECPDDIRLIRRILRDMTFRGQSISEVLTQYLKAVKPMHDQFVAPSAKHAHLRIMGTDPVETMALQAIEQMHYTTIRRCSACEGVGCQECLIFAQHLP